MGEQYDVVVIGSGPGGYVAAIHAAQSGLKTAIVEREETERLGGTCLLRGCIPTKAMLHTADLVYDMRRSEDFGVVGGEASVDMDKMDAYRAKVVGKSVGGVKYLMKKNGVDVHFGHGRLDGRNRVRVTHADGSEVTLATRNVIVATGSACRHLPFLKIDQERIIDSDALLYSKVMPEHLVVLGAGAVGSEFASVFLRYGAEVTLVEMADKILPIEDHESSDAVAKVFKRQGMKVLTNAKLTEAKAHADGVTIVIEDAKTGTSQVVEASHLLVAVGRRPVTDDVGLNTTGVTVDDRGFIEVDEFMHTSEDWVYAIGDIVETPWLAHVASKEGILAVDHIAGADPRPLNYGHVPNCTYCTPEVASVGLTERAAEEAGYDVKVGKFPFSAIAKATILGKSDGFVKIVADAKYGELLGMHIVGAKATELITEATLALGLEATVDEIIGAIHPHPTLAEAVAEAAHATLGHALHI